MNIRTSLAAVFLGAAFVSTSLDAGALEIREPKSHMIVDLPSAWTTSMEGTTIVAAPQDQTFHLRLTGTDHGQYTREAATSTAMVYVTEHFFNPQMSGQAQYINWGNYAGYELFGTGIEKNGLGTPGKFFVAVLTDKVSPRRGLIVTGTGTVAGFDLHQGEIHRALGSVRTY
jgi:hypothetical protein